MRNELVQMPNQLVAEECGSYAEALAKARAEVYGAAMERGTYVSETELELRVEALAAQIMKVKQ
jgi:hypothetical protein